MAEQISQLYGVSFLLLLARFVTAAVVVQLIIRAAGLWWFIGLAMLLSIALAPLTESRPATADDSLALALSQECLMGLCLGATLSVMVAGIQFVGDFALAGVQIGGIRQDGTADPMKRLLVLVMVAGFLQIGGDSIAIREILESLREFPLGSRHVTTEFSASLLHMISYCFRASLLLASPLIATIVFVNLCVGLISRSLHSAWLPTIGGFAPVLILGSVVVCLMLLLWWLPDRLSCLVPKSTSSWFPTN